MTTRLKRPVRRSVEGYIIEITDRVITLRPKRVRRPDAVVTVLIEVVYQRELLARARKAVVSKPRRRVSRSLIRRGA